MLIRNLLFIAVASLLAGTVLTGCHHSASDATAAPGGSTTTDGIAVTYFSDELLNKIPADAFPKDPSIGEKKAVHFFSSINSGDLKAAKSDMNTTSDGYLVKQGNPIGQIAYHIKTDGRITDVIFDEYEPNSDHADFIGMMTFADKKQMHFQINEFSTNQIEPAEKQREEYANGKWTVMAVYDMSNNNSDGSTLNIDNPTK